MHLCLDIGNTLIDIGVYESGKIIHHYKIVSSLRKSKDQYGSDIKLFLRAEKLEPSDFDKAIISSVVPSLTTIFSYLIEEIFSIKAYVLGPGLKSGVRLKVDNPLEVGADLVADSLGVKLKYGENAFVADLGTASKYLYIDEEGAFAGLSIAPGLRISFNALVNGASALNAIQIAVPPSPMGKNTIDCMNSGLLYGTVYEIQGFLKSFESIAGRPLQKILTGGNALYVSKLLPEFIYDESLLLDGLNDLLGRLR